MSNASLSAKKTATMLALLCLVGVGGFVAGLQTGLSGHASGDESCQYWKEVQVAGPIQRAGEPTSDVDDAIGGGAPSEFLSWTMTTKLVCADEEVEESISMALSETDDDLTDDDLTDDDLTDAKPAVASTATPKTETID